MILEALLICGTLAVSRGPAGDEEKRALQAAAQAYYIQSGVKKDVDKKLDKYEKLYYEPLPREVKETFGVLLYIGRVVADERITFRWEF